MSDRVVTQSDAILARLDRRFGLDATYETAGTILIDPVSGVQTPSLTPIEGIKVRARPLSTRELTEIAESGLLQIETSFNLRRSLVSEAKADDRLILSVQGFTYLILRATLDTLELDWQLFARRLR